MALLFLAHYILSNKMEKDTTTESIEVKTANILAELPSTTSKETMVLVNLVKLLLDQNKAQNNVITKCCGNSK